MRLIGHPVTGSTICLPRLYRFERMREGVLSSAVAMARMSATRFSVAPLVSPAVGASAKHLRAIRWGRATSPLDGVVAVPADPLMKIIFRTCKAAVGDSAKNFEKQDFNRN
jgi:hypothetical protein